MSLKPGVGGERFQASKQVLIWYFYKLITQSFRYDDVGLMECVLLTMVEEGEQEAHQKYVKLFSTYSMYV